MFVNRSLMARYSWQNTGQYFYSLSVDWFERARRFPIHSNSAKRQSEVSFFSLLWIFISLLFDFHVTGQRFRGPNVSVPRSFIFPTFDLASRINRLQFPRLYRGLSFQSFSAPFPIASVYRVFLPPIVFVLVEQLDKSFSLFLSFVHARLRFFNFYFPMPFHASNHSNQKRFPPLFSPSSLFRYVPQSDFVNLRAVPWLFALSFGESTRPRRRSLKIYSQILFGVLFAKLCPWSSRFRSSRSVSRRNSVQLWNVLVYFQTRVSVRVRWRWECFVRRWFQCWCT